MPIPLEMIARILRLTQRQKLAWSVLGDRSFRTETGGIAIVVRRREIGIAPSEISLSVYDNDGRVLGHAEGADSSTLGTLYEAARYVGLDVERKLTTFEESLRKLEHGLVAPSVPTRRSAWRRIVHSIRHALVICCVA